MWYKSGGKCARVGLASVILSLSGLKLVKEFYITFSSTAYSNEDVETSTEECCECSDGTWNIFLITKLEMTCNYREQ